jgi:hypothetical protein
MPGPIPKRDEERRRRNEPAGGPADKVEMTKVDLAKRIANEVEIPAADRDWHPVARLWYESLASSGQSVFYEPSDWALAMLLAESLSRDLKPQSIGITEDGDVIRAAVPFKGTSLSAYLKGMNALMVTEGDRRRLRIELQRAKALGGDESSPTVASIAEQRARRLG